MLDSVVEDLEGGGIVFIGEPDLDRKQFFVPFGSIHQGGKYPKRVLLQETAAKPAQLGQQIGPEVPGRLGVRCRRSFVHHGRRQQCGPVRPVAVERGPG
jgi:hypothetical protein